MNLNTDGIKKSNEEINKLTREAIQEALILLMATKNINSISVTEIVAKAGVSRSAYYKNYQFKEEIIRDFLTRIYSTIIAHIDLSNKSLTPYDTFYLIFNALKLHERLIHQLILAKLNFPIHYLWKGKHKSYTSLELYSLNCFEVGFTNLVKDWVENQTKESIEDMANLSTYLFPQIKLIFQ